MFKRNICLSMCVSLQLLAMAQSVVTEKLFSVNSFENGITVKVN